MNGHYQSFVFYQIVVRQIVKILETRSQASQCEGDVCYGFVAVFVIAYCLTHARKTEGSERQWQQNHRKWLVSIDADSSKPKEECRY